MTPPPLDIAALVKEAEEAVRENPALISRVMQALIEANWTIPAAKAITDAMGYRASLIERLVAALPKHRTVHAEHDWYVDSDGDLQHDVRLVDGPSPPTTEPKA